MADVADREKDKLIFVPSKSVTFMPNCSKQMAEMTITNESDKTYMFKMKSTRPGMFKMRPVYGAIQPTEKCTVKLIFKGLKPGQEAPRRERFTVVTAVSPSATVNVEKVWKMQKYQEKLCEGDVQKKKFKILFFGINDQEEEEEENKGEKKVSAEKLKSSEKAGEKKKESDKGGKDKEIIHEKEKYVEKQIIIAGADKDKEKGESKEKGASKEKVTEAKTAVLISQSGAAGQGKETSATQDKQIIREKEVITNVVVKKEFVAAPQRKLVLMMYRDRKEEDDSLSGDDDNDDISTLKPLPQPGQPPAPQQTTTPPPSKPPASQAKPPPPPPPPSTAAKKPGPVTAKPNPKGPTVAQQKQLQKADAALGGAKKPATGPGQKVPAKVK